MAGWDLIMIMMMVMMMRMMMMSSLLSVQELAAAPTQEMRRLLHYLRLPRDETRLQCIQQHSAGSFHRLNHQKVV